jgi:hypothetical protein
MQERELIKIKSDNPAHPHGYYTQFKDCMKPGDVVFDETKSTISEPPQAKGETEKVPEKPTNKRKVKK